MKLAYAAGGAAVAAVLSICDAAYAAELKAGWGLQYQQDTFSGATTLGAFASEAVDTLTIGKAMLLFVCADDGTARFAFAPSGYSISDSAKVDFRGPDGVLSVPFAVGESEIGRQRLASASDSSKLQAVFEAGSGDIPFKAENGQGTFPSIGASQAFTAVEQACAG